MRTKRYAGVMQIDIRNSKTGAALVASVEGNLIIEEAAGCTAFQMSDEPGFHDIYLPGGRFVVEVMPTSKTPKADAILRASL